MAYLTLEGMTVKAKVGSFRALEPELIAPAEPSLRGHARRGEIAQRRAWVFTVPAQAFSSWSPLAWLLRARGWTFSFNKGVYSDRTGLGPNAGYAASFITSSPTPKFGTRALRVSSSGGSIPWNATLQRSNCWSASWWHNYNNSPANTWTHYAVVCDAGSYTVYTNGAVTYGPSSTPPTSPANFSASVTDGTLTFALLGKQTNGTNTALSNYDDLAILPWAMPSALVSATYNSGTGRAWTGLPFLTLSGDCVGGESIVVDPRLQDAELRQLILSATRASNAAEVTVRLTEAEPY